MPNLNELDKEFDEEFPVFRVSKAGKDDFLAAVNNTLETSERFAEYQRIKSFAHKYYEAGRQEEREALKKMIKDEMSRLEEAYKMELGNSKYIYKNKYEALSDLLNELK